MRYPPHILDEIRARLPVSQVVGRKVALKKKGREFAGLSPFKVEKTPSFFINDHKGFYHCFASGEHGDIFTFLMKTEGLSFPEAVERLAAEAGVTLPRQPERDERREDERKRLYDLLEASAAFFAAQLSSGAGTAARAYLDKRGLKRETVAAFRLGYAPASRAAIKEHLGRLGFTIMEMITSGMLIGGEDIPESYDRFRNRVMFPIADLKGRVIAFGGRALDADAPAKYLNSPETPLFHKGQVLFNAARARPAAHEKGRVIAVEGYMDVVALSEAGFTEAVAPLGTALTEDQVQLLWRMTSEPILCFDGDSAGQKAAFRAIEVVLPHLKPGISVRFAFLPDGLDPDDLIRQSGAQAMEDVLSHTRPLVEVLFAREWGAQDWSTPERRAGLERQLRLLLARIEDASVREHYERDIRQRLYEAWGGSRPQQSARGSGLHSGAAIKRGGEGFQRRAGAPYRHGGPAPQPWGAKGGPPGRGGQRNGMAGGSAPYMPPIPSSSLLKSRLVAGEAVAPPYREALILYSVLNHPWLLDDDAERLAALPLTSSALSRLRDAILSILALDNSLDSAELRTQLSKTGYDGVLNLVERAITHKCDRFAQPAADRTEVEDGWRHALELHERHVGLMRSLEAAEHAYHEEGSEDALSRICEIKDLLQRYSQSEAAGD